MTTYTIEHYFVRKALSGKDIYRVRKGKPVDDERTLYLSAVRVVPENPVCVVQLIHGIEEHKDRYIPMAEYLASRGIAVVMHDLRGHGDSILPEILAGNFPNVVGNPELPHRITHPGEHALELLYTDIDAVYASLYKDVPEDGRIDISAEDMPSVDPLPRYLLGFSMGALIAGNYAAQYDAGLAGLMLAGLPHREPMVSFGMALVRFISLFDGELGRSPLLSNFGYIRYNKSFLDAEGEGVYLWLSNDKGNIATFVNDPKCGNCSSVAMYRFLLTLVRDMYKPASWEMARRDLPIWLFSGEKDPVAGGEKWVLDSENFLSDIGYTNIDNRIFPDLRHEIFMDTNKESVWQEVADCILATVESEQARLDEMREKEAAEYTSMFEGK